MYHSVILASFGHGLVQYTPAGTMEAVIVGGRKAEDGQRGIGAKLGLGQLRVSQQLWYSKIFAFDPLRIESMSKFKVLEGIQFLPDFGGRCDIVPHCNTAVCR